MSTDLPTQSRVVVRRVVRTPPPDPDPERLRSRRTRVWIAALAAVVVGVGLVVALLGSSHDAGDDRAAAVAAAKVRVAAMLTFSHEDLEADLSVASGNTTGAFRATYAERLRKLIASTWDQRKASMSSSVTSASFTAMHGQDVGVRLVVRSRLRAGTQVQDQRFVVRATMRGRDGQWLVSDLETA